MPRRARAPVSWRRRWAALTGTGEPSSPIVQLDVREHEAEDGRATQPVLHTHSPGGAARRHPRAGGAAQGHRPARPRTTSHFTACQISRVKVHQETF